MSGSEHGSKSNTSQMSRAESQSGEVQPPLAHVPERRTDVERSSSSTEEVLVSPKSSGFIPPPLTAEAKPGQRSSNSSGGDSEGRPAIDFP